MFIGVDDTDSDRGLCTTYLAAVLMERLRPFGHVAGLPKLIRLNPCARYKTRGNAAVAFEFHADDQEAVKEVAQKTVQELSDFEGENTNPGLVIAEEVTPEMKEFYRRALTEILQIREAEEILKAGGIWHRGYKKGRGLIGALAAIGSELPDRTYELIAYRERQRWGTTREIDGWSVWRADSLTYPGTWDTVDCANRRIVFAPHSKDPILFGIRGDDLAAIEIACNTIISEPKERTVLYQTNQGTDSHILDGNIEDAVNDRSYRLSGTVRERAKAIEGGHVFLTLEADEKSITCSAFEPTKGFRDVVRALIPGDVIEVYGAVRDGCLNMEKINIVRLAENSIVEAPVCDKCGRRMESAGRGQGYRCRRCKSRAEARESRTIPREIDTGFYEVPPSARRHLAKPLIRMGDEKVHPSR